MGKLRKRARPLRNTPTDAEDRLWQQLRRRQLAGFRFRRQMPLGGYIADFVCLEARLIVELDGGQHLEQRAYDQQRSEVLQRLGFRVLRYWNDEVLLRMPAVLEDILRALAHGQEHPSQPSPSLREREG
ncbi:MULTISPECIES: endonuclease domain-containing protein [Stenotrophomonas]|uniref:endonuclease domain-containing protein n=1 Tax=Stenotrophomonas TaxID=40323 RepID=UPI000770323F|nr:MULTISPECIES: endonuclease domain-containing protein [Stenotrophomonas]AMJ57846.1 DNA-cytosine methyltransferase [Stenotrophomonas sp. KCTC 12332]